MKIEIVPEGNKTKKEKGSGGIWDAGWIFETVFGSVKSLVESLLGSVSAGLDDIVTRLARRAFAMMLAVFGLWFLLSGFAEMLSSIYGVPGVGSVLVGILVFGSAVLFSAFWRK
ncbi:MAG: hypothetical protein KBD19_01810 [Candidatus Moranbacteria bacterium]|nr:hypothetical protein [Candidatus Moranbacteria bacterium]